MNTPAVQNLARGAGESGPVPGVAGAGAEAFSGLEEELGRTVLGQPEYLKALCIALEAPVCNGGGRAGPAQRFSYLRPAGHGSPPWAGGSPCACCTGAGPLQAGP